MPLPDAELLARLRVGVGLPGSAHRPLPLPGEVGVGGLAVSKRRLMASLPRPRPGRRARGPSADPSLMSVLAPGPARLPARGPAPLAAGRPPNGHHHRRRMPDHSLCGRDDARAASACRIESRHTHHGGKATNRPSGVVETGMLAWLAACCLSSPRSGTVRGQPAVPDDRMRRQLRRMHRGWLPCARHLVRQGSDR